MAAKVFVSFEYIGTFECPKCKKSWNKNLSNLKDRLENNRVKCNCPCGHSFPATLDRRRYPRKLANLTGAFVHDKSKRRGLINVKNISKSGLGFILSSEQFMHIGDRLGLKFNLDDPEGSFLYKEVIVKKIDDMYVGVEFCEFRHRDALESYLKEN